MNSYGIIGIIVVIVVLLIGCWIIGTYNQLVVLRNKVKDQWSQVDIQLKQRFDLIPNVVETVKGYAKHENETLTAVVEARNKAIHSKSVEEEMQANSKLSNAISRLFALAESYPELKADKNFLELQKTLGEMEEKIGYARSFYNDTVLKLNNKIEVFPTVLVARLFGFHSEKFFEAAENERENVKVKF